MVRLLHITIVVLVFVHLCCGDQRDYLIEPPIRKSEIAHFRYSLFPTFKQCIRVPRQPEETEEERAEPSSIKVVSIASRTMTWSSLVNVIILPDENTITADGKEMLRKAYSEKPNYIMITFGVFVFIVVGIFVGAASALIIPFIGCFIFQVGHVIHVCVTNRLFRKIGRRFLIQKEWIRRQHEIKLIDKSQINRQPPPPRFRLPKFYRDYSEEEVPEELLAPHGTHFGSSESDGDFNVEQAYHAITSEETRVNSEVNEKKHEEAKTMREARRSAARKNAEKKRQDARFLKLKREQEKEDLKMAIKKEKLEKRKAKTKASRFRIPLLQSKPGNTTSSGTDINSVSPKKGILKEPPKPTSPPNPPKPTKPHKKHRHHKR